MRTSHRSAGTRDAWGVATDAREPVFEWTPSDTAGGRAILGRVGEREGGARPDRLRFGTYLASNVTAVALYELVTEEVGRRLGLPTELVVETSYESCEKDQNEVCFVCSLPYVTFERRGLDLAVPVAAPVLQGERYGGRPIYFSDVIVHRDSPFRSFLDLQGRSWAYNEPLSHSGYGITRYHLVTLGETNGFFGQVVEAGFHHEAIRMVARGDVDGSAIDSQVLAIELRDHPDVAERVRIVEALGPSTIQPVAVSKRVPEDLREAIRGVLVTWPRIPWFASDWRSGSWNGSWPWMPDPTTTSGGWWMRARPPDSWSSAKLAEVWIDMSPSDTRSATARTRRT
jgi:phosphonate transport system substrate-binding protein